MALLRALTVLLLLVASLPAMAQGAIRDDETERYLRRLADPLLEAAGLRPEDLRLFVLADPRLNAFVAGGQNLFIFTGLIEAAETPEQLAGVIAHEIGHIAGGHLTRMVRAGEQAGQQALIGALLGIAAVVAGAPQLGTAAIVGSQGLARQRMLTFTRTQEQAADQAAVTYLSAVGMSPRGLLEVMELLDTRGRGISGGRGEFLLTHPLTRDRIRFLENQVTAAAADERLPDPALEAEHRRIVAKLVGFLAPPQEALRRYWGEDFASRYARAIALYRDLRFDESTRILDELLRERPKDPYLLELKGQFLFERGRVAEAEPFYRKALALRPDSALMRVAFARTLIEQDRPELLPEARAALREAIRLDRLYAPAYRLLGVVAGRLGDEGESFLALAEWAVLRHDKRDAELYLRRAEERIGPDDRDRIRLEDLRRAVAEIPEPRRRKR